jgi:hypothetical protein
VAEGGTLPDATDGSRIAAPITTEATNKAERLAWSRPSESSCPSLTASTTLAKQTSPAPAVKGTPATRR